MSTTIHNLKDLAKLRPNAKYRIEMDTNEDGVLLGAWIRPTKQYYKSIKNEIWSKHNIYLSKDVFSESRRKWTNDILHKYGFDVKLSK